MCCAGCLHPDYDGYFASPAEYLEWYARHGALAGHTDAPTVAVLLYRKHVITQQGYIAQLVRCFEADGVRPVPIFINGIEAHTVVRHCPTPSCRLHRFPEAADLEKRMPQKVRK